MQSVSNRYAQAVIIEVKEITNHEGTSYRVLLEQKEKKYSVKFSSLGDVTEAVKLRKK
ncbi:MAG: hypothetical protein H7Y42_10900 [Chitinophagaceae bacterium]|nr:hypothetical protein [Chitinophagaceae bacterium]